MIYSFISFILLFILNIESKFQFEAPHNALTYTRFNVPAVPMHEIEYDPKQPCSYKGFNGLKEKKAKCYLERDEHELAKKYIKAEDKVLELGARFGTTSCVIASQLKNSGHLVSVEPDPHALPYLESNRDSHYCNFIILPYPIGNVSFAPAGTKTGYANRVAPVKQTSQKTLDHPTHYTFDQIQDVVGFRFTTLLIDCEGCIQYIFQGSGEGATEKEKLKNALRSVHTIIIEGDMPISRPKLKSKCEFSCVNYDDWETLFKEFGFELKAKTQDIGIPYIFHYAFQRVKTS